MFTVKIWVTLKTIGGQDITDIDIVSQKSLRAAKNKATRWINRNYFASDIESLTKDYEGYRRASWDLTIKNPWR